MAFLIYLPHVYPQKLWITFFRYRYCLLQAFWIIGQVMNALLEWRFQLMNRNALLMAMLLTALLSGCAANQQIAFLSSGVTPNQGISSKNLRRGANLGLQSAIGSGVDITMASALLLNSSDYQTTAAKYDHLEAWMPLSEAKDEHEAKLKMSAILEHAIHKTLAVGYKTRIGEYENEAVLGVVNRTRFIRIDGPDCENWSCAAYITIPSG
ncbi:MAG: hypothetical protein CTY16_12930 [Methylobacter sp.]|nr:MAG: hypothetical protein CTY16_12930 [Methylobacter sp.]